MSRFILAQRESFNLYPIIRSADHAADRNDDHIHQLVFHQVSSTRIFQRAKILHQGGNRFLFHRGPPGLLLEALSYAPLAEYAIALAREKFPLVWKLESCYDGPSSYLKEGCRLYNFGDSSANFDLLIAAAEGTQYTISVISPLGDTTTLVNIPPTLVSPEQLERLQTGSMDREEVETLGRSLARCLLYGEDIQLLLHRNRTTYKYLKLRLRLDQSPIQTLPLEYLFDDHTGDFFALNPATPLIRYLSLPVEPLPLAAPAPLSLLVLVVNPAEQPTLDTLQELRYLFKVFPTLTAVGQLKVHILCSGTLTAREAVAALVKEHPEIHWLSPPASLETLQDVLRQGVQIVHFIGHGTYQAETGGSLYLEDDDGSSRAVQANVLARLLRGSGTRLMVLNNCHSAVGGTARSFMGIAPALVHAGIPAVVAMQGPIRDTSAASFARGLYGALAAGRPLEQAATEGRQTVSYDSRAGAGDWGMPVLFMRSPDGRLWQSPTEPATAPQAAEHPRPTHKPKRDGQQIFVGSIHIGEDMVLGDKIVHIERLPRKPKRRRPD